MYDVGAKVAEGDVADLYESSTVRNAQNQSVVLKVARDRHDNDLLMKEAQLLTYLYPDTQKEEGLYAGLPRLLDSSLTGGLRFNVLSRATDHVSLEAVLAAYPTGLDFRDVVWMYKRILGMLGFVHAKGVIHGAVIPPHFMVHPVHHGGKLLGWSYGLNFMALYEAQQAAAAAAVPPAPAPPDVLGSVDPLRGMGAMPSAPPHMGGPVPVPRARGRHAPPDPPPAPAGPQLDVWALLKQNLYDDPAPAVPGGPIVAAGPPPDPDGMFVKAISVPYREYYAPEILRKERPGPETDIYMAAKCAVALLGGNPKTNQLPANINPAGDFPNAAVARTRIQAFLQLSLLDARSKRLCDAYQVHEDFEALIHSLVGKPRYRQFSMPAAAGGPTAP
jgi:serine/threonine protein kinase